MNKLEKIVKEFSKKLKKEGYHYVIVAGDEDKAVVAIEGDTEQLCESVVCCAADESNGLLFLLNVSLESLDDFREYEAKTKLNLN